MSNTAIFEAWKHKAEEDWAAVLLLREHGGPNDVVCFHCHQLTEKYLKGFALLHDGPLKKIHQLDKLLEDCLKIDPSLSDLASDVSLLKQFYIPSRYPDDFPEDSSAEETTACCEAASRVRQRILAGARR